MLFELEGSTLRALLEEALRLEGSTSLSKHLFKAASLLLEIVSDLIICVLWRSTLFLKALLSRAVLWVCFSFALCTYRFPTHEFMVATPTVVNVCFSFVRGLLLRSSLCFAFSFYMNHSVCRARKGGLYILVNWPWLNPTRLARHFCFVYCHGILTCH